MSGDKEYLTNYGGVKKNDLMHVLNIKPNDENDENFQMNVISHSPYYDNDRLVEMLVNKKKAILYF